MDTRTIILAGVLPGFIVGLTLVAAFGALPVFARRKGRREAMGGWPAVVTDHTTGPSPAWAALLAVIAAVWLPIYAFRGLPEAWWPVGGADRIWQASIVLGILGLFAVVAYHLLDRLDGPRRLPATLAAAAAVTFGAWIMLSPLPEQYVGPGGPATWGPIAGLIVAAGVYLTEAVAPSLRGWRLPFALLPVAALAAPAHFTAGFAGGAIMLTGVIAALSAALVAGLMVPRLHLAGGPAAALIAQLTLLHTVTRGYAYEPGMGLAQYLLLAGAPLGLLAAICPGIRSRSPWLRTLAAAIACAALAGSGAAFTIGQAANADGGDSGAGSAADYGY